MKPTVKDLANVLLRYGRIEVTVRGTLLKEDSPLPGTFELRIGDILCKVVIRGNVNIS